MDNLRINIALRLSRILDDDMVEHVDTYMDMFEISNQNYFILFNELI